MGRATYGIVELEINGKQYELKPTLQAYEKIETRMGGLRQAIENCSNMSLDGLTYIVAAACGIGAKGHNDLKEDIFAEGTLNVLPKVTEYLMKLLNPSGKEADDLDEGDGESGEE